MTERTVIVEAMVVTYALGTVWFVEDLKNNTPRGSLSHTETIPDALSYLAWDAEALDAEFQSAPYSVRTDDFGHVVLSYFGSTATVTGNLTKEVSQDTLDALQALYVNTEDFDPLNLLPREYTLLEAHALYVAILGDKAPLKDTFRRFAQRHSTSTGIMREDVVGKPAVIFVKSA